jgi:hypothetical protein
MLAAGPGVLGAQGSPPADVRQYLTGAGFSAAEAAALESGTVIARVVPGTADSEVMVVAAVKIRATREQTLAYYGQMVSYVDGQVTTAFGRFSNPPVVADVKDLVLDADDLAQLRSCTPGDCDLRIGGTGLQTLRTGIDWTAPDASAQAQARVREAIVNYAGAYMKSGDAALVTYTDRSEPVSLREQWRAILAASPYFRQYNAALSNYLIQYPNAALPGARDVLYWVREDYTGLKPVLSVVHGVIYEDPANTGQVVVAQKQLYASHYYDGSLAIAVLVSGSDAGAPYTYLLYGNRSRGDLLKGGFGGLRRTVARNQARSAAERTLGTIKRVLEKSPATSAPTADRRFW